jgi:hypothetical protein
MVTVRRSEFAQWSEHFSEWYQSRQRENMVMNLVALGAKNHYAGEGQQQFSSQSSLPHNPIVV